MKLRKLLSSAAIVASSITALNVAPAAQAYTLTPNGKTAGNAERRPLYDIHIDGNDAAVQKRLDTTTFELSQGAQRRGAKQGGKQLSQAVLGKAVMTVMALDADSLSLQFRVRNRLPNKRADQSYQAAITSLWFGVKENVTDISVNGGDYFNKITTPDNKRASGGFKDIDVCIFASDECNSKKTQGALQLGHEDTFTVHLKGDFDSDGDGFAEATISDLGMKWQTQDGSYAVSGVPEPITMLGTALAGGFGIAMKRKSGKNEGKQKEKNTA
ncbi:MAG: cistern family PEP-CTERM protein [Cyanobacteria bacterium P01_G01_bin.38]